MNPIAYVEQEVFSLLNICIAWNCGPPFWGGICQESGRFSFCLHVVFFEVGFVHQRKSRVNYPEGSFHDCRLY